MKKKVLTLFLLSILLMLFSCSAKAENERTLIGESEIVVLPSGKKNYFPISRVEDLDDGVYVQESSEEQSTHLEFSLKDNQFIERTNGAHPSSVIYDDIQVKTYLDVYEIVTPKKTLVFIKIGPRTIEDEHGMRYTRVN